MIVIYTFLSTLTCVPGMTSAVDLNVIINVEIILD